MDAEFLKFTVGGALAALVLWFAVTRLARFLAWVETSEIARQAAEASERRKPAHPAAVPASVEGVPEHHVAAIAAAVAACGYRVAHIADPRTGSAWASEGRRLHQTSHHPH